MSTLISIITILIAALAGFESIYGEPWVACVLWALAVLCSYCGHLEHMDKYK